MPEHEDIQTASELTSRQQLEKLLESAPHSCRDLSQQVHLSEKEVLHHLEHLSRSLRPRGLRLQLEPAVCRNCGFSFDQRKRLAKPGRCPECRKSTIEPPVYYIERI